ncbi:MAG: hypothetical protein KME10_14835 [Plectolyngbya sp. WJT66-NPBG17]|jgi:hypothetical protein|nr:hypothetical protein [Plectolyngbya sp. WJT66-NPBG17]MBW4527690.1 hypothetical protein [Phormidium tanganyikae FI6-MK23]
MQLKFIRSLGLRFWLLLPLLGGLAWILSGWATDWILTRSNVSDKAFVLEASDSPAIIVQSINVAIQPGRFAIVTVYTLNQPLRQLEFRFPVTEPEKIERAIAQVLGLSQAQVKQVIRYNAIR